MSVRNERITNSRQTVTNEKKVRRIEEKEEGREDPEVVGPKETRDTLKIS
jgi:hypothetical protein